MDKMDRILVVEKLNDFFHLIGGKTLLKNYECPLGEIDLIVKHKGRVFFIAINRTKPEKTAKYYLARYGIRDVDYDVVSL